MKAKLIINNQEIEIEISQEEYEKLKPKETKTGYECVKADDRYYYVSSANIVEDTYDNGIKHDKERHKSANYYSARSVAENNARADKLMRQLRRFAVEHRDKKLDWNNDCQAKYFIACGCRDYELRAVFDEYIRYHGVIYFDTREKAQAAIDTFHDELMWYFTEYKDSL